MSISGSLSSALSGLTAAAKAAEVVSSNIANATTEGYGRREVITTARAVGHTGQGVQIVGVRRDVDAALLSDRRRAEATGGERDAKAVFFQRLEAAVGTADSAISLGSRVAAFDTALLEAASLPDSEARRGLNNGMKITVGPRSEDQTEWTVVSEDGSKFVLDHKSADSLEVKIVSISS